MSGIFGSRRDEARDLTGLDLKRGVRSAAQAGGDQLLAQPHVVNQPLDGGRSAAGIPGLHKQRAVGQRTDAADGGRDGGQSARVGLDQDLREALGVRHVQERMATSVQVEQPTVEGDVTPELAGLSEPELCDSLAKGLREVALAAYDQAPAPLALAQASEHVGQQQGILLGVKPSDREQHERVAIVGASRSVGTGLDIGGADQGDRGIQDARRVPVAPGQLRPDRDDRRGQRERSPDVLEQRGSELQAALAGVTMADVGRQVLAHPEHKAPSPDQGDHRQCDCVGVGPQREDAVGIVEHAPHAPERARDRTYDRTQLREPLIVREGHKLDGRIEGVVGRAGAAVEAPEQPQPANLPGQRTEEARKRTLREHGTVSLPVGVVGVNNERHRPSSIAVSVLVPVRNESAHLDRTVPAMLAQRFADGEIEFIFAEGASNDDSRARLEQFAQLDPRVRIVDNPSGRTPDGLNIAFACARGEFIARMDAHAVYPSTYLADAVARIRRGGVAWVAGPKRPRPGGGASGAVALALSSPLGQGPSRHLARRGSNEVQERELDTGVFTGVWHRSSIERHGGWDPRWLRNQDSELAARFLAAGERIVSLESLTAEYIPRPTLRAFWRQYHEYGRYRAFTLVRHPIARRRSHALAPALVASLPAAVSAAPMLRVPARLALGAYALAVGFETTRAVRTAPLRDAARLPPAFGAMHFAFGAGIWRGLAETLLRLGPITSTQQPSQ